MINHTSILQVSIENPCNLLSLHIDFAGYVRNHTTQLSSDLTYQSSLRMYYLCIVQSLLEMLIQIYLYVLMNKVCWYLYHTPNKYTHFVLEIPLNNLSLSTC
jgi:hypothetical protein